ncbi:MAG: Hsp33 family molecular chaperone [Pseudomonadota bacterium]
MSDLIEPTPFPGSGDDRAVPFQIERSGLRGRIVRLGPALNLILSRHAYPAPVAALLGETLTLAVLMATALKFDGIFTLQVKGAGPVSVLVADVTSQGAIRGYAGYDSDGVQRTAPDAEAGAITSWLGKGHLAFTVDQGEHTQRYQGIVELTGDTLAECLQHYFRQSEQIDAGIQLAVGASAAGDWRGAGLMIQRLPGTQVNALPADREDDWRRAMVLMASVTSDELLDPSLPSGDLLYRLFHEDGVRVFDPVTLEAVCRCSDDKVTKVLAALPKDEVADLTAEDGKVHVTCEFCTRDYAFSPEQLEKLYGAA